MNKEITVKEISKLTDVNVRTVRSLLGGLTPVKKVGVSNYYNAVESLKIVKSNIKNDKALKEAKTKLLEAQIEKLEIDNEIKKGKFISYNEVVIGLGEALAIAKHDLMNLPVRISDVLGVESIGITKPMIIETLNTLADNFSKMTVDVENIER